MSIDLPLLASHAHRLQATPLAALFGDAVRAERLLVQAAGLSLDLGRQRLDAPALDALLAEAHRLRLPSRMRALFEGEPVNPTESRPALHTALRSDLGASATARAAHAEALAARQRMEALSAELEQGSITDIVSVGIGGSDLGPRLVVDALGERGSGRFRVHFLANVDGHAAARLLRGLDPSRTAVLLVSKSFGTQETLLNGRLLRDWLGDDARLYAITANLPRAAEFGIPGDRVLPMWDWVGGRYSLWSAVGWSIRLALGRDGFDALLAGAADMDAHALSAAPARNLALLHALAAVWNRSLLAIPTLAVLPYDDRLGLLPAFLQQLVMESLGKRVRLDGSAVDTETVPVVWGGVGTNSQHSFFQALHQGTQIVACDFIGVIAPDHVHADNHRALLSNLLAQSEALACGRASTDPHRHYPGGRPSSMILLERLDARRLGALLALYEHSVYLQSVLWGINAFDQWGVELGKELADQLLPALSGSGLAGDSLTRDVLARIRKAQG
jgi:glucose-6-phosphate isomerase